MAEEPEVGRVQPVQPFRRLGIAGDRHAQHSPAGSEVFRIRFNIRRFRLSDPLAGRTAQEQAYIPGLRRERESYT